ncbi:DUF883 family protein [Oleiagrimonas sp. C23AA]|uniref:DUF883 family protein n=1 Tax=Oleiagrimonas sp. C23AA TaxID=2719047 RepID=UPI00142066EB|nr:DUF883 family protein [Oleiagrimonas sp. C23AA]NII11084.1 DUF883 domain-containing protein [Oleiagrimonas sp. C23AA]
MSRVDSELLKDDLRIIAGDVEHLMQDVATGAGERGEEFRQRLHTVRERLNRLEQKAAGRAREANTRFQHYVHEQPWVMIGTAATAAFLFGLITARSHH